jgi:hypothetical protein
MMAMQMFRNITVVVRCDAFEWPPGCQNLRDKPSLFIPVPTAQHRRVTDGDYKVIGHI